MTSSVNRDTEPGVDGTTEPHGDRVAGARPNGGIVNSRDYDQTIPHAQAAIQHIDTLRLPADPPSFEVWYAYATRRNPTLNGIIDQLLRRKEGMSIADLDQVYHDFVSLAGIADRFDSVGMRIDTQLDQLVTVVDSAAVSATRYGEELAGAKQVLLDLEDLASLRTVVERLVETTGEIERQNRELHGSLIAAKGEIRDLQVTLDTIRAESLTDPLTGLANRKHFDRALARAVAESAQSKRPLSFLLCDVDGFKQFNDRYGHLTGDEVLRLIASSMTKAIRRGEDVAARYGGEEFSIILPNTNLQQAVAIAKSISESISSRSMVKRSTGEKLGQITISVGVVELRADETGQDLIDRADTQLYRAKREGRNRVAWA